MKTRIVLIIMLGLVGLSGRGQITNWEWVVGASGTGLGQEASYMTTDLNGNAIITGGFADSIMTFGAHTIMNSYMTQEDSYIAKFSPTGTVLWMKSIGGSRTEITTSICTDLIGNIYLTGYSNSPTIIFGNINVVTGSINENMFIVKYDPNGNVLWAKTASGIYFTMGSGVKVDSSFNVYVSGSFLDTATFDTITLICSATQNAFLIKYDSTGNALWGKSSSGTGSNGSSSVCIDNIGNVIMVGGFYNGIIMFGNFTLTNTGSNDIYIVKYNSGGNVIWAKSGTGISQDCVFDVAEDVNGNIYITGWFNSPTLTFNNIVLNHIGGFDIYIIKFDSNGNAIWGKSFGGVGNDYGYSISVESSGNIYLTAGFTGPSIMIDTVNINVPANWIDPMIILKLDTNGNILCKDVLGSGGEDQNGISVDNLGNAIIAGDYNSNPYFIVGFDTLYHSALAFVAKLHFDCLEAEVGNIKLSTSLLLSPNPFTTQATLTIQGIKNENNKSLSVYNLLGQEVQNVFVGSATSITVHRNNLPGGMYFYKLTDDSKTILGMGKMMVE